MRVKLTQQDILRYCPSRDWITYRHCVRVQLVDGQELILRGSLMDWAGLTITRELLCDVAPFLQKKSDSILDSIIHLVDSRVNVWCGRQNEIINITNQIILDVFTGTVDLVWYHDYADRLYVLLSEDKEPALLLDNWRKWLQMLSFYVKQQEIQ